MKYTDFPIIISSDENDRSTSASTELGLVIQSATSKSHLADDASGDQEDLILFIYSHDLRPKRVWLETTKPLSRQYCMRTRQFKTFRESSGIN